MRLLKRLCVGLLVFASWGVLAEGVPLVKSRLARDKESTMLDKRSLDTLRFARATKSNKSTDVVSLDPDATLSTVITVAMPNGRTVVFRKTSESTIGSNSLSLDKKERDSSVPMLIWNGASAGGGELMISVLRGEINYGEIHEGGTHYVIAGIGNGRQVIIRVDVSHKRQDATPEEMDKGRDGK